MITLEEAAAIVGDAGSDGGYLEVRRNAHEVILGGDRQGLLWLAAHCLRLALRSEQGSHLHLDQTSTDLCEQPLVIRRWHPDHSLTA